MSRTQHLTALHHTTLVLQYCSTAMSWPIEACKLRSSTSRDSSGSFSGLSKKIRHMHHAGPCCTIFTEGVAAICAAQISLSASKLAVLACSARIHAHSSTLSFFRAFKATCCCFMPPLSCWCILSTDAHASPPFNGIQVEFHTCNAHTPVNTCLSIPHIPCPMPLHCAWHAHTLRCRVNLTWLRSLRHCGRSTPPSCMVSRQWGATPRAMTCQQTWRGCSLMLTWHASFSGGRTISTPPAPQLCKLLSGSGTLHGLW